MASAVVELKILSLCRAHCNRKTTVYVWLFAVWRSSQLFD